MEPELKYWHMLFEAVEFFVHTAGGDGDGWIITHEYKKVADEYQKSLDDLVEMLWCTLHCGKQDV